MEPRFGARRGLKYRGYRASGTHRGSGFSLGLANGPAAIRVVVAIGAARNARVDTRARPVASTLGAALSVVAARRPCGGEPVVGALGRLFHPGRDPIGLLLTVAIGVVSLLIAALISSGWLAFIIGVIVAVVLVALVGRYSGRRRIPARA